MLLKARLGAKTGSGRQTGPSMDSVTCVC